MRRTTVHSFRKYDNDGKIHYTDTADTDDSLLTTLTDADCDVPNREKWSKRDSDCLNILNLAFLDGPAMLSAIDEAHARARN